VADASDERRNGQPAGSSRDAVANDVRTWHERFAALDELLKQLGEKEEEDAGERAT
jgi:hypothetical protein